jgi:MoaD family protein
MKIKIKLLKPLSDVVGTNELILDFKKVTLDDLLKTLLDQYPLLKHEIFTEKNQLTEYINIFVNNKPFAALNGLKTELHNGDMVLFFVPISGG